MIITNKEWREGDWIDNYYNSADEKWEFELQRCNRNVEKQIVGL